MNSEEILLIHGYLDDCLTEEQHVRLSEWIREHPDNALRFAAELSLHDALRNDFTGFPAGQVDSPGDTEYTLVTPKVAGTLHATNPARQTAKIVSAVAVSIALMIGAAMLNRNTHRVSASVTEAYRIISQGTSDTDRTYRIHVEEVAVSRRPKPKPEAAERRPPKPPIDDAILYVRGNNQFVLIRRAGSDSNGDPLEFITGSNEQDSWAIRPDGPVRVSADLTRFNRDVPGHEHSLPLINVREGLSRLKEAYDVQLLPPEESEDMPGVSEPSRLLVAVKRRGYRGPRRVEISYGVRSGQIQQMRFIEMPYGPEHLTLRLTLLSETPLSPAFFDHESHNAPERTVEREE